MKKIKNPEIKEYIKNFVPTALNNCELFTSTFGKHFAQNSLDKNLKIVYTNDISNSYLAYQDSYDKSITFCVPSEDNVTLTVQDIKKDENLQSAILHEALHAILTKDTKHTKLSYGTGMLEGYSYGNEIGRGLNEGLTNWICDKANFPTHSYLTLTNFINEIELAIGEKHVMNCAKGNIKNNISKQLNMSENECLSFLAKADNVFYIQADIDELREINQLLNNPLASRDDIASFQLYDTILKNSEQYKKTENFSSANNRDDLEKEIFYKAQKDLESDLVENKTEFENQLYNKYFREEFEELLQMDDMHIDKIEKFSKLYNLVDVEEVLEASDIGYFKLEYNQLKEKYFDNIISQIEEEFENGTLSKNKLGQLTNTFYQLIQNDNEYNTFLYKEKFYNNIEKIILIDGKNYIPNIEHSLNTNNQITDTNNKLPTVYKRNLFSRIFDKIKNKFSPQSEENSLEKNEYDTNDVSKKQLFKKNIGDMTQYSSFLPNNLEIDTKKENENEKDER